MQSPGLWGGTEPFRILAVDGTPVGETAVGLDDDALRDGLRRMVVARRLDRECIALQRQGELTVYPGFEGQEAAQIGSAIALGAEDFVFPTFRELAVAMVRGVDVVQYLQYHRGTWHGGPYDTRATRFGPICIPIATQIVHAIGHALGTKLDHGTGVTVAYFGDGSTSEGDFHEAANLAGVWQVPAVLFCHQIVPTLTVQPVWRSPSGEGSPTRFGLPPLVSPTRRTGMRASRSARRFAAAENVVREISTTTRSRRPSATRASRSDAYAALFPPGLWRRSSTIPRTARPRASQRTRSATAWLEPSVTL